MSKDKKYYYRQTKEKIPLVMPERGENNDKVIRYLTKTRCIDPELIQRMIDEDYLYQDNKGNCVFLGYTRRKKLRHISLHTTNKNGKLKIDVKGSEKEFSFSLRGSSSTVNVFESTIDLLSFMTIYKNEEGILEDGFVSLGGVGRQSLRRFLGENRNIEKIRICTDNDEAGEEAVKLIIKEFGNEYKLVRRRPHFKDFNEDLVYRTKHKKS